MTVQIHIDRESGLEAPNDDNFSRWAQAALLAIARDTDIDLPTDPEFSLRINDLDEMTALNLQYRGKSGPTNVLSFPTDLPEDVDCGLLGDIIICAPVVIDEAHTQGKDAQQHWTHMLIHGVLHLLGFDHIDEAEAATMENLETAILREMGHPDPYETPVINQRVS